MITAHSGHGPHDPSDPADLVARLFELLEEPREIAAAEARLAGERCSLDRMIDAYEAVCVQEEGERRGKERMRE